MSEKGKKVRIIAINSSPKINGTTSKFLKIFTTQAKKLGAEVITVNLYDENIIPVTGKLKQRISKLSTLQNNLIECDGFVIATPTYWFNMPGVLKNLIDNLTIFEENGFLLEGKVAGLIVYSPQGGEMGVISSLSLALNHMGVIFPPYSFIFYRGVQDKYANDDIPLLAKNMISQIKSQRDSKINWGY